MVQMEPVGMDFGTTSTGVSMLSQAFAVLEEIRDSKAAHSAELEVLVKIHDIELGLRHWANDIDEEKERTLEKIQAANYDLEEIVEEHLGRILQAAVELKKGIGNEAHSTTVDEALSKMQVSLRHLQLQAIPLRAFVSSIQNSCIPGFVRRTAATSGTTASQQPSVEPRASNKTSIDARTETELGELQADLSEAPDRTYWYYDGIPEEPIEPFPSNTVRSCSSESGGSDVHTPNGSIDAFQDWPTSFAPENSDWAMDSPSSTGFEVDEVIHLPLQNATKEGDQLSATNSRGLQQAAAYPCLHSDCKTKPFRRQADLARHMKQMHIPGGNETAWACDYGRCSRQTDPFRRKDHFRDHLREYHREDLIKRHEVHRNEQEKSSWYETRRVSPKWWRCRMDLCRVSIQEHGFTCPECGGNLEAERRENRRLKGNNPENYPQDIEQEHPSLEPEEAKLSLSGMKRSLQGAQKTSSQATQPELPARPERDGPISATQYLADQGHSPLTSSYETMGIPSR